MIRRAVVVGLCLLGMSLGALPAAGQDRSALRVLVLSGADGNPVAGANVMVVPAEKRTAATRHAGVTNSRGLLELAELVPGQYRLHVSHVSHEVYADTLQLQVGTRHLERVTLPVRTREIDEVVVRETRDVATGAAGVRTISPQDMTRIPTPGPGGDMASYLRTLPSVEMAGSRGGNLHVRGGKPTQNQVLIDGIPVAKPFHILNVFSPIPSAVVQNIDFHAGGFGAQYLGKTSSVLDVNLRPGNMRTFSGEAAVSPYLSTIRAEGPIVKNEQSFLLVGRKSLVNQSAPYLPETEPNVDFYDLTGRYSLLTEHYSCNATALRSADEGKIDPARPNRVSWKNMAAGVRCLGFSPEYESQFEITVGYSGYQNAEYNRGDRVRFSNRSERFLSVDLKNSGRNREVTYGFEVRIPEYRAELDEQFGETQSLDKRAAIFETFASLEWRLGERFRVHPSIGAQVPLVDIQPTLEPRLRLAYVFSSHQNHEVSLATGRYVQLSYGFSDTRDVGSVFTVLTPYTHNSQRQSSLHGILGYQGHYFDRVDVSLEGYVKRHQNMLVSEWTPNVGGTLETAQADGLSYGVDTRIEYQGPNMSVAAGYGWSKVRYEAASGDLGAWIQNPVFEYAPAHDRRHKVNLSARYRLQNYRASIQWSYGSGRPYTRVSAFDLSLDVPDEAPLQDAGTGKTFFSRPYGARLPSYHRLDLSVGRTVDLSEGTTLDVKAGVLNAYNRENIFYLNQETLRAVDQIQLTPYVSMKISFQ